LTHERVISIRWKMMMMVFASGFMSLFGAVLIMFGIYSLGYAGPFRYLVTNAFLMMAVAVVVTFALFIVSFLAASSGTIRYLSMISSAVNQIAGGDLDAYIPVKSKDEIGRLAADVNQMASRLKESIEEERRAEKAKNELITSVSHDLRTPLTSILGYLALVDDDKYEDEVTLRHYISIVHEKAQNMKELVDDLFEFTKMTDSAFKLDRSEVNLGRMLEQLAEEFVPILSKAGMEYRMSLPDQKVVVQADPSLLVRVLENIMSNAVRYGSEGRFMDIELHNPPGWAVIRIANYGPPIPATEIHHIFERFVRVEGSRSRNTGGAGLGLAIAKSIVNLHGGTIRAYNDDKRTVFEVSLEAK
jgi:signal transduction histidine kinase